LTPGTKYEKADAFSFTTSNIPTAFQVNGNNVQQTSASQSLPFTPGVDTGSITTMSVRGGAAAAPTPQQVTAFDFLTAPTVAGAAHEIEVSFSEIRVVTAAGAPTQLLLSGNGAGTAVVPVSMRPTFLKTWAVSMVNNNTVVTGLLFMTTGGVMGLSLPAGTALTVPFGFNGDVSVRYLLT
jgi:hypothetical protein